MPVDGKTSRSSADSSRPAKRARKQQRKGLACHQSLCDLPQEVLELAISHLPGLRGGLGLILLSMTCREMRKLTQDSLQTWYKLYLHWRGPVRPPRTYRTQRGNGVVSLLPTYPTTLPNFRLKPPPLTLTLMADKPPSQLTQPEDRRQALVIWRRIVALQSVPCCGMCGTTRHSTRPYWSLGMRVCRRCMQTNLVSSTVLYERYWQGLGRPALGNISFVDLIHLCVFYFRSYRMSPAQRMEFSTDPMDFPRGKHNCWFFWKPHLAQILDMERLEREAQEKHAAARVVRAFARRFTVMRALRGTQKGHQIFVRDFARRKDMRTAEDSLRRKLLMDQVDPFREESLRLRMSGAQLTRLYRGEDRLAPLYLH